jgi:hypothetical protein
MERKKITISIRRDNITQSYHHYIVHISIKKKFQSIKTTESSKVRRKIYIYINETKKKKNYMMTCRRFKSFGHWIDGKIITAVLNTPGFMRTMKTRYVICNVHKKKIHIQEKIHSKTKVIKSRTKTKTNIKKKLSITEKLSISEQR